MKYLTEKYWGEFITSEGKRDGIRFEVLIEKLLNLLYGKKWLRTPVVHDHGRDFELMESGKIFWAECKNFSNTITYRVLSPTLVMAIVEDVDTIIFFSYSSLSRNTINYLGLFQESTKKKVHMFHNLSLERVILNYFGHLKDFFPEFEIPPSFEFPVIETRYHVSNDPEIEYYTEEKDEEKPKRDIELSLLEIFSIDVIINSLTSSKISGEVSIDDTPRDENFILINGDVKEKNYSLRFSISPGGLFFKRFYFRTAARKGKKRLPEFLISIDDERQKIKDIIKTGYADVRSIFKSPLVGNYFYKCIEQFRRSISYRDKPVFFSIKGLGGTGKSRLMRELKPEIFAQGFTLHAFEGEAGKNTSFNFFIQNLISKCYRLPTMVEVEEVVKFRSKIKKESIDESSIIYKVLYGKDYIPSEHFEDCLNLVKETLTKDKVSVFIDNVQGFDEIAIKFFNSLIDLTIQMPGRVVFVFCFNEELIIPDTQADLLLNRLESLGDSLGNQFFHFHIKDFTHNETITFLDNCLSDTRKAPDGQFSKRYPELKDLFLEKIVHRPLFIDYTLRYLDDKNILRLIDDYIYFKDPNLLTNTLNDIPQNLEELIKCRWLIIGRSLTPSALLVLKALTFFVVLPENILNEFGVNFNDILHLEKIGFIRKNEKHEFVLYHQTLFNFLKKQIGLLEIDFCQKAFSVVTNRKLERLYYIQYFLLADRLNKLNPQMIQDATELVITGNLYNEYISEFITVFLRALSRHDILLDPGKEILAFDSASQILRFWVNFADSLDVYERSYNKKLKNYHLYYNFGERYFKFILNFSGAYLRVRKDDKSLELLEWAADKFDYFKFQSESKKNFYKCWLLDRLCVSYRSMWQLEQAIEYGKKALRCSIDNGFIDYQIQSYIDLGYVYYGRASVREKLLKIWKTAVNIYESSIIHNEKLKKMETVAHYHKAHVLILEGKFQDALKWIDKEIKVRTIKKDTFHKVKLHLLRINIGLMAKEKENFYLLWRDFEIANDWSIRYNAGQSLWVTYYAAAKISFSEYNLQINKKEKERKRRNTLDRFSQALEQLSSTLQRSEMEYRFLEFFEDMAITYRLLGANLNNDHFDLIKNPEIRHLIKVEWINCSQKEFEEKITFYRPSATYGDGKFNLPTP